MQQSFLGSLLGENNELGYWRANGVRLAIDRPTITLTLNWDGNQYSLICKEVTPGYFKGTIVVNKEATGSIFFWLFIGNSDIAINGGWQEDGINYELWGRFKPEK